MTEPDRARRTLELFSLETEGPRLFTGHGGPAAVPRLFGGQIAAQSFVAAALTVNPELGHRVHSLHGYFLRPGRGGVPVRFAVHALKDGRNFSARDVVASQGEEVIFSLHVSFMKPEPGISHLEAPMPEAPAPETLTAGLDLPLGPSDTPMPAHVRWMDGLVQMRSCDPDPADGRPLPSRRRVWIRPRSALGDDLVLHTAVLIWVSDRSLIRTGSRPHGLSRRRRRGASLDHCMWFHQSEPRFDDWWLYVMDSPVANDARALIQGAMYRRDGTRMVSIAQEGLIRS
jgi:acyl-CoA thioesterase II